jgi:hypothetical protein
MLAAALLVVLFGVNVPFWDQWELAPLLAKQQAGTLTLHDLMEQHNEHRMLFPQLIMVGLAPLTGWDIRAELAVNYAFAALALAALIAAVRPFLASASSATRGVVWFLLAATIFSLSQWENWLWGWQIQWFLSLVGVIAACFGLKRGLDVWATRRAAGAVLIAASGAAATVVQLSIASGVMLWPIGLLMIALHPADGKKIPTAVWAAVAVVANALFFHGWHSAPIPGMPTPLEALADPLRLGHYVLAYISGPIGRMWLIDLPVGATGAALLVFCFAAAGYLLVSDWSRRAEASPWLGLVAFVCGGGLVTGLGRVGFGVEQGLGSRYVTLSMLLTVAAVGLGAAVLARRPDRPWLIRVGGGLAAALGVFLIAGDVKSFEGIKARSGQLAAGRVCLLDLAAAPDDCLRANLYPEPGVVRAREPILRAYGWSGFAAPAR